MEIEEVLKLIRSLKLSQFRQMLEALKTNNPEGYNDLVNVLTYAGTFKE